MKRCNRLFFAGILCACTLLPECIERDNPWDLYNGCHPAEELPHKQDSVKQEIEAVLSGVSYADTELDMLYELFRNRVVANSEAELTNSSNLLNIERLERSNNSIDSINLLLPTDSAMLKNLMGTNVLVTMQLAPTKLPGNQITPDSARSLVGKILASAELICPNQEMLDKEYVAAAMSVVADWENKWQRELESIVLYNNRMLDSNRVIDSINARAHYLDSLYILYNDSLNFRKMPKYTDPVEIKQRIDSVTPGTVIAIDADSISLQDLRFVNKGAPGSWVRIVGAPQTKTIITAALWPVEISGSKNIRFENLIFRGAINFPGVRIIAGSDSIRFYNCEFNDGEKRGVDVDNCGNVNFENCLFLHNGNALDTAEDQGGLRLSECYGVIGMKNVLIAGNHGCGVDINRCHVVIDSATIADNQTDGVRYTGTSGKGSLRARSVLFAFNGRFGIYRNNENVPVDIFATASNVNRFFGNVSGEMGGSPSMAAENAPFFSADPVFINRAAGDYHIGQSSMLFGTAVGYQYP